jgi:hypothetical protein
LFRASWQCNLDHILHRFMEKFTAEARVSAARPARNPSGLLTGLKCSCRFPFDFDRIPAPATKTFRWSPGIRDLHSGQAFDFCASPFRLALAAQEESDQFGFQLSHVSEATSRGQALGRRADVGRRERLDAYHHPGTVSDVFPGPTCQGSARSVPYARTPPPISVKKYRVSRRLGSEHRRRYVQGKEFVADTWEQRS